MLALQFCRKFKVFSDQRDQLCFRHRLSYFAVNMQMRGAKDGKFKGAAGITNFGHFLPYNVLDHWTGSHLNRDQTFATSFNQI